MACQEPEPTQESRSPMEACLKYANGIRNYMDLKEWINQQSDKLLLHVHSNAHQRIAGTSKILVYDEQRGKGAKAKLIIQSMKGIEAMQTQCGPLPVLLREAARKSHSKFCFILARIVEVKSAKTKATDKVFANSTNSCSLPFVTENLLVQITKGKEKAKPSHVKDTKEKDKTGDIEIDAKTKPWNGNDTKEKEKAGDIEIDAKTQEVSEVLTELSKTQNSSLSIVESMFDHFTTPMSKPKPETPQIIKPNLTGADVRTVWISACDAWIRIATMKAQAAQADWLYS